MIAVEDLSFTYSGTTSPAVHRLSFTIEKGEIFGFLGPSGAGKSTTQKILTGLLRDYQGQVAVFGRDLASWADDYYERIGVSFETPNHFLKLTAVENLTYFASLYRQTAESPSRLLEMVGLDGHEDILVSQFSKGMKNRLTVARALLHRPELLFLDEPTAGLDPVNARRIQEVVRDQQRAGRTIFLTTHDMTVAETLCDRVAFIVDGEINVVDNPSRLRRQYGRPTVRVTYSNDGQSASRDFPLAGIGEDETCIDLLRTYPVETIHTQEATLEDVFIQVTGRKLQ